MAAHNLGCGGVNISVYMTFLHLQVVVALHTALFLSSCTDCRRGRFYARRTEVYHTAL